MVAERTDTRVHVAIVGASLSGLMSALALARAGSRVTVLERTGSAPRSGAALAVDGPQLRAVLGDDIAGPILSAIAPSDEQWDKGLPVTWEMLHRALHHGAADHPLINVRYDSRVESVGQDHDRAWVTMRGHPTVVADAVVGADGHRSLVRRSVAPERPDARFAGYVLWLGITDERSLELDTSWPTSLDICSGGAHYLLGYPLPDNDGTRTPGHRRLGWAWYDATRNELFRRLGSVRGNVVHHTLRPHDIPPGTYEDLASEIRRTWPSPWREAMLASVARRDVTATPIAEYVPSRMVSGRLALVGDAAHVPTPMTGRGFAASLDDAGALAKALEPGIRGGVPVSAALLTYEQRSLHAAQRLVESGKSFSRSFALN
ncbi:FAD-dependent monooxygenase [Rhodococcus sp. NPDC057529]|uniref:FAD-dependent monooxygenase n=1 Tax=Rhodococcus sp. NPDC057529 TaxID=3346158 RepID=UPI00366E7180